MNRDHIPSIADPSSPWYALSEWRKPNLKWCEGQNNSWIIEPANTWSNLAYVIAAIFIARHSKKFKSKAIKSYGWVMLVMGLCSGIYHASYTFVLQVLDFFGMYLMTYLMILVQLKRLGWAKSAMNPRIFCSLILGTTAFTIWCDFYTDFHIQKIILVHTIFILASEVLIRFKSSVKYSMKHFYWGALFMGIAVTFSGLDASRVMCDPDNHLIQGHALWHVFSAVGLTLLYLHHSQFDRELS